MKIMLKNFKKFKIIRKLIIFIYFIYILNSIKFMNISIFNIICYITENAKNIYLEGQIFILTEAGKAIVRELNTIGTQLGLWGTILGVVTAVGKTIAKSFFPPVQKAGIVVASSLLGGLFYSSLTFYYYSKLENWNKLNRDSNISDLLDEDNIYSPLEGLLINLVLTNFLCVYLLILLVIQLLFKFYFKEKIKLNLTWIFGLKWNKNLEFLVNKIIIVNKKISIIYIRIILVSIIFALFASIFLIQDIYTNLDEYVKIYKFVKTK